jgi:hypothetical protein
MGLKHPDESYMLAGRLNICFVRNNLSGDLFMDISKLGVCALIFSASIMSCVISTDGPTGDPSEQGEPVAPTTQLDTPPAHAMAPSKKMQDPIGTLQEADSVSFPSIQPQPLVCIQEPPPPCIADQAICGARCCDGLLFRSVQVCGNCRTWANGACLNHGGWIRLNWTPL